MSFEPLGLSEPLLKALAEQGYDTPTPVQAQAIPVILAGRDVLAAAQTGTGKTAGFTLPLLQLLAATFDAGRKPAPIRALILTPTRELALQVLESVKTYGSHLPLKGDAVTGGVSINSQIRNLSHGRDILVATPGRLLDHIHQRTVDLSKVEILVLDEADRMLDMGFLPDVKKIMAVLPKRRQNLLFSATFSEDIKTLANQLLDNPAHIAVARQNATAERISQQVYGIPRDHKRELLSYLIGHNNWQQVLIFVRTKHGADRLAKQLIADGIRTAALHGDKSQGARIRALDSFKTGQVTALVATDIAARGIDINELPHVVNYDLPQVAEDYVHRIGRTGRAGSSGAAISLVCTEEAPLLAAIEKLLKQEIPRVADTGYAPVSLKTVDAPRKNTPNPNSSKKDYWHSKPTAATHPRRPTTGAPPQGQARRRPARPR